MWKPFLAAKQRGIALRKMAQVLKKSRENSEGKYGKIWVEKLEGKKT